MKIIARSLIAASLLTGALTGCSALPEGHMTATHRYYNLQGTNVQVETIGGYFPSGSPVDRGVWFELDAPTEAPIVCRARTPLPDGGHMDIVVRDTGMGIEGRPVCEAFSR